MINKFKQKPKPKFTEEIIINRNKDLIGVIRITPSSVMWKPKGKGLFLKVDLGDFIAWITDPKTRVKRDSK
jgi:hypothetical protein